MQAVQREKSSLKWTVFKEHLAKELTDRNPNNVYDALSCLTCHLDSDRMEFVAQVKCTFAVLGMNSNGSEGLNLNKIIKSKMINSFPRSSRERLELFMAGGITLERFIERFVQERTIALAVDGSEVRQGSPSEAGKSKPQEERVGGRLAKLEKKLERIDRSRARSGMQRRARYCPYFRSASHNVRKCSRNPRPGSCFDCFGMGCWRGKTSCPGRVNNTK